MENSAKVHGVLPADGDDDAVAIMVHGTFSASKEDSGEQWWQHGSATGEKLQSLLPDSVRLAEGKEVFHWSGENSERARSKAAAKLLKRLDYLESKGKRYHLVGHSHGGSVIWNALQMSVLLKRPLRRLGSWTTVGTPFMHHRSRGVLNLTNLLGLIVGLLLLVPAMGAPKQLVSTLYGIAVNDRSTLVLSPDNGFSYRYFFRTPVLTTIELFGIEVDRQPDGIHIGSFDPNGTQSLAQYCFATPEGLFLLILLAAVSYFFIHCTVLCISPAIESYRIRLEQKIHERAFDEYGARWLGIWSPDDEAINGLRATLNMSVSFVGKMFPREVVYMSDTLALLSRPYYWLLAPLYNRFVHPAVDGKVRNIVIRAAQGNDRPTATLTDVLAHPAAASTCAPPPLPALLNVRLLSFANRHAHDLVPKLRALVAQNSFASGIEVFGGQLSGKELVHTAYFEQEEILKLIAANMTWDTAENQSTPLLQSMPPWLRKWFMSYKQQVAAVDSEQLTVNSKKAA